MIKIRLILKKAVVIAICLAGSVTMFAQDIIIMKNGNEIRSVVQEVGTDEVKYKKFDNLNGPNYTLKKSEIFMIKYENGSKELFNEIATNVSAENPQQSTLPELSYRNGVWQNNRKIKPDRVREIMYRNVEALQQYNSGRSLYVVGQVIAYPSAFFLGWELGARIVGRKGSAALLGVGVAGTFVGLIIAFSGENKMKTAVQLYNSKVSNTTSYQINLGFTQTGVGLCMQF